MARVSLAVALALCLGFGWPPLPAAASDAPPVLTVSVEGAAPLSFTAAELAALPQRELVTTTEFTDGPATFSGPLARDVLAAALAATPGATEAAMRALNDYTIVIPLEDFARYDVVLATSMNGKPLSRRDKGPIWLMYPLDDHAELQDPVYVNRLIWQLVEVTLR